MLVLTNCQWDVFPAEFESLLVEKLSSGTGLVLTYQWMAQGNTIQEILSRPRDADGERHIAGAVPTAQIPGFPGDKAEALVQLQEEVVLRQSRAR